MVINGIQQIGIGVVPAREVYNWYKNTLGFAYLYLKMTPLLHSCQAILLQWIAQSDLIGALHRGVSVMWKTRLAPL